MGYTIQWHIPGEAICVTYDGWYQGFDLARSLKELKTYTEDEIQNFALILDYSKAEMFDHDGTLAFSIPIPEAIKDRVRFMLMIANREQFTRQAELLSNQTGWTVQHCKTWREAMEQYTTLILEN